MACRIGSCVRSSAMPVVFPLVEPKAVSTFGMGQPHRRIVEEAGGECRKFLPGGSCRCFRRARPGEHLGIDARRKKRQAYGNPE